MYLYEHLPMYSGLQKNPRHRPCHSSDVVSQQLSQPERRGRGPSFRQRHGHACGRYITCGSRARHRRGRGVSTWRGGRVGRWGCGSPVSSDSLRISPRLTGFRWRWGWFCWFRGGASARASKPLFASIIQPGTVVDSVVRLEGGTQNWRPRAHIRWGDVSLPQHNITACC